MTTGFRYYQGSVDLSPSLFDIFTRLRIQTDTAHSSDSELLSRFADSSTLIEESGRLTIHAGELAGGVYAVLLNPAG